MARARDLGDFQTPAPLVRAVLECLSSNSQVWARVLEPTCGRGNFIEGLLNLAMPPREIQGIEIQEVHLNKARKIAEQATSTRVVIRKANIFGLDLHRDLQWNETGPLLVVGNPPWVTNAELGALGSDNLPRKTNLKGLRGIDALTGKSNFDIAEYIWLKLISELAPEHPTIALLCKTSVARNIIQFAFEAALPITGASIRRIDAKKWFGAAVDACLFCVEVGPGQRKYEATVYQNLHATEPESIIGIASGQLIADVKAYVRSAFADGVCPLTWRQGLKHDAASVMELTRDASGGLWNKHGEVVAVEPEFVYPLLKSSDVFRQENPKPRKAVIVTQKVLGEDTRQLKRVAPRLWSYLTAHANVFERRKSSIYRGRPPFSIFGIGDYSFAPYKVAISGLYKTPKFRAIGPIDGYPVMLDDTCYFLACYSPEQAALLTSLLNDPACLDLIHSLVFWDSKRPITKTVLQRIDLRVLLDRVERQALLSRASIELERFGDVQDQRIIWPPSLEELLMAGLANPRSSVDGISLENPENGEHQEIRQLRLDEGQV